MSNTPFAQPDAVLFPLWHLALQRDWEAAQASGRYEVSTLGRTLAEEGYLHCSYPHQLGGVARAVYAGVDEPLVVLEIDRDALARAGVPVKVEALPGTGGQRFPHLYGALPTDAVLTVRPAAFDQGGGLVLGTPEWADPDRAAADAAERDDLARQVLAATEPVAEAAPEQT